MIKVAYEIYKVLSKLGIKPKDVIGMGGDIVKMGKSLFNTRPNPTLITFIEKNQKIPTKILENIKIHARTLKNTTENQKKLFLENLKSIQKAKTPKIPVKSQSPVTSVYRPGSSGKELPAWTKGWTPKVIKGGKDGLATGGIAPLFSKRQGYEKGKVVYGMENKPIDILEDFTIYPDEAREIKATEAAKADAKKKERWQDVLKYDSGDISNNSDFFRAMRVQDSKIKNLLNTTIAQLALIYPDKETATTLNELKQDIMQASVEGVLKGDILGNAITLTKVLDFDQESTQIDIESPILNVSGDVDENRYNLSKNLNLGNINLGYNTTFDEGDQTASSYSLDVPFNLNNLEGNVGFERDENKYNTSDSLNLDSAYTTGNLTAGLTGNVAKDDYGITTALEPSLKYDIPTDYGTLSASASKNIIEGGDANADLSYTWGDTGHPSDKDQFWRISANLDPIEGDKKAFVGFKSKFAKGGIANHFKKK